MRALFRCLALAASVALGSCVMERVVDDDNEPNRLIEEESAAGLRR